MISKNKKRITVSIDAKVAQLLEHSSKMRGTTKSAFIEATLINSTRMYGSKKLIKKMLIEIVELYLKSPADEYGVLYHIIDDFYTVQCIYNDGNVILAKVTKEGVIIDG